MHTHIQEKEEKEEKEEEEEESSKNSSMMLEANVESFLWTKGKREEAKGNGKEIALAVRKENLVDSEPKSQK